MAKRNNKSARKKAAAKARKRNRVQKHAGSSESMTARNSAPPARKQQPPYIRPDIGFSEPEPDPLEADDPAGPDDIIGTPIPVLRLSNHGVWEPSQRLAAEIIYRYSENDVPASRPPSYRPLPMRKGRIRRNHSLESGYFNHLRSDRIILKDSFGSGHMVITSLILPRIPELLDQGWQVESDGHPIRIATHISMNVKSGIDWFDLRCTATYGEIAVDLLAMIDAFRTGNRLFQLPDGSFAMIPEDIAGRIVSLFQIGRLQDSGILRFQRSHALFIDTLTKLLDTTFDSDEAYKNIAAALRKHDCPDAVTAPVGFHGQLRAYQQTGLSWLVYLRDASFGGCLADDMGLGKTIQVLAYLQYVTLHRKRTKPCLAVVPRSLLSNWKNEAERFTPELRVIVYHGPDRNFEQLDLEQTDILVTTYATLRNDIADFTTVTFDTCILDEAQVIKNRETLSSKAVRLLYSDHRLVLTGTPIENNLGDLWSLFDFLNPGLLGHGPAFRRLIESPAETPDVDTLKVIASAVSPFLLRRTKEQVLPDLPEKTEITLYCEMEGPQLEAYRMRLAAVRAELMGLIKDRGIKRSKIRIIEALLRLRQCACHAGLADPALLDAPSAKIDLLLEQLDEVTAEGHKALVFSQFTSFLALVRKELDTHGISYTYLDGKTRNRQACVDRFQNSPDTHLFLISLKAGGLGLNLTAADYVYILDPWWNPAAEAQAIDRTHRIGQSNKVFAYRIIARDSIEEKVLALQDRKRDLAAAILNADQSIMKKLDMDDLQLLLS